MTGRRPPTILISAGETSGDRLGAGLARALRARRPELRLVGMGGERMEAEGVERVQDASEVAVVGIVEVLAHLPALRRAMDRLRRALDGADLLVPIDYPDFNLRLAKDAGRAGVPVVYFVSPQVWAWRKGRVKRIRRLVRRMLVLFPFERAFYDDAGVPVTFVGHPAVDLQPEPPDREAWFRAAGLDPARPAVALLPGSRRGEIGRLLPVLFAAAERLRARRPELQFVLPVAPGLDRAWLDALVAAQPFRDVALQRDGFAGALAHCAAGAVASGTASLESALAGLPIVVVYRIAPLSYLLGRMLVDLEHVALPNLVAGRRLVPELIQGDCTPERVAAEVARYLDDPERAAEVRRGLAAVRERLGEPGVFDRAAEAVLAELDRVADPE